MYILQSKCNNKYYVGCTHDVNKRLETHNKGRVTSTKSEIPWKQIYIETYETQREALSREKQIKNWKSRKAIEKLLALSSSG